MSKHSHTSAIFDNALAKPSKQSRCIYVNGCNGQNCLRALSFYTVLHYTKNQNTTAVKNAFWARSPDQNSMKIVPIWHKILSLLKSQGTSVFSTVECKP